MKNKNIFFEVVVTVLLIIVPMLVFWGVGCIPDRPERIPKYDIKIEINDFGVVVKENIIIKPDPNKVQHGIYRDLIAFTKNKSLTYKIGKIERDGEIIGEFMRGYYDVKRVYLRDEYDVVYNFTPTEHHYAFSYATVDVAEFVKNIDALFTPNSKSSKSSGVIVHEFTVTVINNIAERAIFDLFVQRLRNSNLFTQINTEIPNQVSFSYQMPEDAKAPFKIPVIGIF